MLTNQSKIQLKLFQRKQLKTAESTSDLTCHKVAIKITKAPKISSQNISETLEHETNTKRTIYISRRKAANLNKLRLI